jgi:AcrR family transcriptional regulator
MPHSATQTEPGLRERKCLATRDALVETARELSAQRGFSHFTVAQLCDQVGVSRRTFFNYFPTKEDAFLGQHSQAVPSDVARDFVRKGDGSRPGTLSPRLFDDLADMLRRLTESMPVTRETFDQTLAAIDKDPKLLAVILRFWDRTEAAFRELVAHREGIEPTDPRAQMAAALITVVSQRTVVEFFRTDNTRSYSDVLTSHVAAVKAVFQTADGDPNFCAGHQGPPS